jgi:molybdenum cofactor synthesis domain-containing protein
MWWGSALKLLEPEEAVETVYGVVGHSIAERVLEEVYTVELGDLHGRLLAEPVRALTPLPPTVRSTLDGFAVSTLDLVGASTDNPVRLKVVGYSGIGDSRILDISGGECVQVDTGAIVPRGADAVVPVEDVVVDGGYVVFTYKPQPGSGLALPASDVASGDLIAPRGARAYPDLVAALASQGYRFVRASRRVRVAIFSSGSELLEPGDSYRAGGVYDSNRYYIASVLRLLGYDIVDLGIVPDDLDAVRETLYRAAETADIVIASGGTSVGSKDYVHRVLESEGRVVVRGLRIKPGKPTIAGLLGGALTIGIPGNPRAAVNVTRSFLIPLLDKLGLPALLREPLAGEAVLATDVSLDRRRRLSLPLATVESERGLIAIPVATESYMISSLPLADSKAELEKGVIAYAGTRVRILNYRYPERTLLALTDTRLLDLGTLDSRVVTLVVEDAEPVVGMLRGARVKILLSTIQLGGSLERHLEVEWSSRRRIVKVGSPNCRRVSIFKPYTRLHRGGIVVSRAETAVILLNQGYVDCSIIPEDYAPQGVGVVEELGSEEVVLASLR